MKTLAYNIITAIQLIFISLIFIEIGITILNENKIFGIPIIIITAVIIIFILYKFISISTPLSTKFKLEFQGNLFIDLIFAVIICYTYIKTGTIPIYYGIILACLILDIIKHLSISKSINFPKD